jgi:5-methylcytosine-specific restriction endonuclease McrA
MPRTYELKPCRRCGGPKPGGYGRALCDACRRPARLDSQRRYRAAHPTIAGRTQPKPRKRCRGCDGEKPLDGGEQIASGDSYGAPCPAPAAVEHVDPLIVLELRDGMCGICGSDVDPLAFEVDHVVALARGGLHNYENCQPAHGPCNRRKWAHMVAVA